MAALVRGIQPINATHCRQRWAGGDGSKLRVGWRVA